MKIVFAGNSGSIERERQWSSLTKRRLFSFWDIKKSPQTFANLKYSKTRKKNEIVLDSGAYSAWKTGGEVNLDEYIKFILENESLFDVIVNLDVIPGKPFTKITKEDVEASTRKGWRNYKKMLAAGVPKEKLLHVFHQGEDFSVLQKMVKEIPYIGISPANDKTVEQRKVWLDKCMEYVTDKNNMPIVKFHGFGITEFNLMFRYPWYSVDSTTWIMVGNFGKVLIPPFKNGKYDYSGFPMKLSVSTTSPDLKKSSKHIDTFSPKQRKILVDYLHFTGFKLGKSEFHKEQATYILKENERWSGKVPKNGDYGTVEVILEEGVCNMYRIRDDLNILYYTELEKHMPKYPCPFKVEQKQSFLF